MLVKRLKNCEEIVAGDMTLLREILNPRRTGINLSYSLAYARVRPGHTSMQHRLKTSSEVCFVLRGQGVMHVNDESEEVMEGDTVYIPPNAIQYVRNSGNVELEFLCMVSPPWRMEDEGSSD